LSDKKRIGAEKPERRKIWWKNDSSSDSENEVESKNREERRTYLLTVHCLACLNFCLESSNHGLSNSLNLVCCSYIDERFLVIA